jgi:hypothetical protein
VFSSLFQHGGRPLNSITQAQYRSILSSEEIRQMFRLGLTYRPGFLVNSAELTGLAHLPDATIAEQLDADIDQVEALALAVGDELAEGTPIGTISVAGQESIVCIPYGGVRSLIPHQRTPNTLPACRTLWSKWRNQAQRYLRTRYPKVRL